MHLSDNKMENLSTQHETEMNKYISSRYCVYFIQGTLLILHIENSKQNFWNEPPLFTLLLLSVDLIVMNNISCKIIDRALEFEGSVSLFIDDL